MKLILLIFSFFCVAPSLLIGQNAGTPDISFGQGGQVIIGDSSKINTGGYTVLLPDGKIILASYKYEYGVYGGNRRMVLTRLLPNGSFDPDYGISGQTQPIDLGSYGDISKIALTAEGKLIVTGRKGNPFSAAFVARLDDDGQLDSSFGQDGIVSLDYWDSAVLYAILIKPDGNILLGGSTYHTTFGSSSNFLLVQLLPDGTPDPAFGTEGIATADFFQGIENTEVISSLALQADGKIVAAGYHQIFGSTVEVIRFNMDGTIDQSFAAQGVFIFGEIIGLEGVLAVAIQDDQKIICSGFRQYDGFHTTLYRLQPDGSLDDTFGTNGIVFTNVSKSNTARSIVLQADGKILVGVESKDSISPINNVNIDSYLVLRFNSNGSLDSTFGNNGKAQTPPYEYGRDAADLLLQPDGKILHAGNLNRKIVLWRYLNDTPVSLQEILVNDFQLQCSPNPIIDQTNLSWSQTESGEVRCDLYDLQGKLLQTLLSPTLMAAGDHQKTLHLDGEIPIGVCVLVLKVGEKQQVLRLVKM